MSICCTKLVDEMIEVTTSSIFWKELVGEFGVPRNGKWTKGTSFETFLNFLQMGPTCFRGKELRAHKLRS